jgi:hypothetical protein
MNKNTLTSVIDKYYLNGVVESVKWDIKDKAITVDFITPMKNLVGKVTSPNFDLEDIDQQNECFHYTNHQPLFKTTEIAAQHGYQNEIGNRNKNKY